jgi:hypothetical protein
VPGSCSLKGRSCRCCRASGEQPPEAREQAGSAAGAGHDSVWLVMVLLLVLVLVLLAQLSGLRIDVLR